MAFSGLLLALVGLGGCAVMVVVIIAVVWVILNERKKSSRQ